VGDIILALIDKGTRIDIHGVDQFNKLLAPLDKKLVTLLVRRGEQQVFITIKDIND
jgi:hypothetical protein